MTKKGGYCRNSKNDNGTCEWRGTGALNCSNHDCPRPGDPCCHVPPIDLKKT